MPEPSLELLQTLIEHMLEQQRDVTTRLVNVERRLERVERAVLAGQRLLLDRTVHALDAITRRVETLEAR